MIAIDCLKGLQKFIKEEVADKMEFQKENTSPAEYINPNVYLISLPHKNFIPLTYDTPSILIGLNEGIDSMNENVISILIQCKVYGGYMDETIGIPDEKGYLDLINLIERIKLKLIEKGVINGKGTINKPITYGIYNEEITYPYHYGYISFDMQLPMMQHPLKDYL